MIEPRVKISGLILNEEGKLLLFRGKGKTIWISPGGKVEGDEEDLDCLSRELQEEANIELVDAEYLLTTPIEEAAGNPGKYVVMKFYVVKSYDGTPTINPEDSIEAMRWISVAEFENRDFEVGSGLVLYAIPELIKQGLMK